MALDFSAAKYLAGKVAIPAAFPEVAKFALGPGDELQIIESKPQWKLVRNVSPRDVIVFATDETDQQLIRNAWRATGNWYTGEDYIDKLKHPVAGVSPVNTTGIAYLVENAPVLMQVEFGMIAADAVEYYPPVTSARGRSCCEG